MFFDGAESFGTVELAVWPDLSAGELQARAEEQGVPSLLVPISDSGDLLDKVILQLETAVAALYPAWLPEAKSIFSSGGAGCAAVQSIAREKASRSDLFGPYLVAISEHALAKSLVRLKGKFAPETRLRECYKLFSLSYATKQAALIIEIPSVMSSSRLEEVQQTALFLSAQGGFCIWFTNVGLEGLDRIPHRVTSRLAGLAKSSVVSTATEPHFTPLSGKPHPWSKTENRMENYLSRCNWAVGRAWNANWSDGPLSNPVTVDLIWRAERLVVEFDGPDHLAPEKYARDRQRDRALQTAGFAVLRFTNEEVAEDISGRASEIERFVKKARNEQG